jgi:hypothetical protein
MTMTGMEIPVGRMKAIQQVVGFIVAEAENSGCN